jgi:nucleotide-binding universal stress UspA family protein
MAAGVHIITVGTEEAECGQDLVEYLGWHGIAATSVAMPPVLGARTGEQLLAAARDVGADLLVMGGWSHAPWRDMLFGGTTHDVVAASLMALLLAH